MKSKHARAVKTVSVNVDHSSATIQASAGAGFLRCSISSTYRSLIHLYLILITSIMMMLMLLTLNMKQLIRMSMRIS